MATVDRQQGSAGRRSLFDEDGSPWLENGERMDQKTFHARYEKTPPGFKAELIGGIVYVMASPLSYHHGRADSEAIAWLVAYKASTPGTAVQNNATAILGDESEPQPDSVLLILPESGGQTTAGGPEGRYTVGAPELVVEVAFSSRSIDLTRKRDDYERAGVKEYVVVDLTDRVVLWFARQDGHFVVMEPDADGIFRSRAFPGLWLDPVALIAEDSARMFAALNQGLASPEHAAFVEALRARCGG